MSKSDDEHVIRVKRGAFPTPKSEVERAERFVPESTDADDTDRAKPAGDSATADHTTPGTDGDAPAPSSPPGPDDQS